MDSSDFCYAAPLAVITAAFLARQFQRVSLRDLAPTSCLLLLFAVLSMNRGYPGVLGATHSNLPLDVPLGLEKATLKVSRSDAGTYQRVVALVERHIGSGQLVAGPDCPEIYFLTDQFNISGALFDFLGLTGLSEETVTTSNVSVAVINHGPAFSRPFPPAMISNLRGVFPNGESVGHFEVRWRH